jgi:hypothetical protein
VEKTISLDVEKALKALCQALESNDESLSRRVGDLDKSLLALGKALHTRADTHAGHNPKQSDSTGTSAVGSAASTSLLDDDEEVDIEVVKDKPPSF